MSEDVDPCVIQAGTDPVAGAHDGKVAASRGLGAGVQD